MMTDRYSIDRQLEYIVEAIRDIHVTRNPDGRLAAQFNSSAARGELSTCEIQSAIQDLRERFPGATITVSEDLVNDL